ncbi:pyridoxamine 5'-phosphate oxidase family protein [Lachnoclostridium sp.]|uniref:pyridoxamine 5'-phosphate oxidase family protein n=1 Tax=Lachnoclostridium sp. TaxID=2028282 RepID=UPI00289A03D7|nr:pyridoxamine 5'-phosphate oxidase family protein [Lachnoclostridium sp.]
MRKADREIKDFNEVVDVLERCDTIRIGIFGEEYPYVVPLSFGYEVIDNKIILYVHGAKEGKKHDLIGRNSKVCIEADICHRFTDTGHSVTREYESIIGYGEAVKVFDQEAIKGLELLVAHCGFDGYPINEEALKVMTIYQITLEYVTGKRRFV